MRISAEQLKIITGVLDNIEGGRPPPRLSGRIGRFLRQYQRGQHEATLALLSSGVSRRADSAISGEFLGSAELHPVSPVRRTVKDELLGEVADVICVSEELGTVAELVLWMKSSGASAAYNLITRQGSSIRLSGDYRWTPLTRITPGTSSLGVTQPLSWQNCRCLRTVADEIERPPHALEYRLDYRLGPPGLKFFRSVTASYDGSGWWALPALDEPKRLRLEASVSGAMPWKRGCANLCIMLLYREPWSDGWTLLRAIRIEPDEALAHAVEWADFQCELQGRDLNPSILQGISHSLRAAGIRASGIGSPNLHRQILSPARNVINKIRGTRVS